jgi:hypothetical protein
MTQLTIGSATDVYGNACNCVITRHWVEHALLADVSRSLRSLVQLLGDEAEDEYWRQTLSPVRKTAFALCSVPLPFNLAATTTGIDFAKIQRQTRLCQQLFPDAYGALAVLVEKLKQLSQESNSPLIAPLEELLGHNGSLSVITRNPRLNQAAASYFASNWRLRHTRIVSPTQLRGAHTCDALAIIGPCGWFPEYVFTAPRAAAIHVISFRWIRDDWKPGPVFLHSQSVAEGPDRYHCIGTLPKLNGHSTAPTQSPSELQPSDLLPVLPVLSPASVPGGGLMQGNTDETIAVKLCHLSGNRAVLVAADEGATSLIIDTSVKGHSAVRRVPTDELEPGFYLLVRTSGGGDFIAPLADLILGNLSAKRREQQAEWKKQLAATASQRFGNLSRRELAARIVSELRSQGWGRSEIRTANVHYWLSSKCISPRKADDFAAIMNFAGLHDKTMELWAAMNEIDRAHKRAGFLIRRMLLQKITQASLEPLERDGEMVFDLGDEDGGTLSAFQITSVQDIGFEVAVDRIGVLIDMEE